MNSLTETFEHDGIQFSYREGQVLLCCAYGHTIQDTADILGVSYHTIKAHREHLRDRLNLHKHNALARFAIKYTEELEKSVKLPI